MTLVAVDAAGYTNPIRTVQGGSQKLRRSLQAQHKVAEMSQNLRQFLTVTAKDLAKFSVISEYLLKGTLARRLSNVSDKMANDMTDILARFRTKCLSFNLLTHFWLKLTLEDKDFARTQPVPKDLIDFLFFAHHDPAAVTYRGIFHVVQQLAKAEPETFTFDLCTLEVAASQLLQRARLLKVTVPQDLRVALPRIVELLIYLADRDVNRTKELTTLLNQCKTASPEQKVCSEFIKGGSILVKGFEQFASDRLAEANFGSFASPAYAVHCQATRLDAVLPLPSSSRYVSD